jgi:hypothetical protein
VPEHAHGLVGAQQVDLDQAGLCPEHLHARALVGSAPGAQHLVDWREQLDQGHDRARLDIANFQKVLADLLLHRHLHVQNGGIHRCRRRQPPRLGATAPEHGEVGHTDQNEIVRRQEVRPPLETHVIAGGHQGSQGISQGASRLSWTSGQRAGCSR